MFLSLPVCVKSSEVLVSLVSCTINPESVLNLRTRKTVSRFLATVWVRTPRKHTNWSGASLRFIFILRLSTPRSSHLGLALTTSILLYKTRGTPHSQPRRSQPRRSQPHPPIPLRHNNINRHIPPHQVSASRRSP